MRDNKSEDFRALDPADKKLWRDTYRKYDRWGYPHGTCEREAWLKVQRMRAFRAITKASS